MTPQFLDILVLALIVSAHITAAQFLHQDADDADEQDEIDLVEKERGVILAKSVERLETNFYEICLSRSKESKN